MAIEIPPLKNPGHQHLADRFFDLLRVNYAALGFSLLEYYCVRTDEPPFLAFGEAPLPGCAKLMFRWGLQCPCGASEAAYTTAAVSDELATEEWGRRALAESLASNALQLTASRSHLEEDVARGTLPPSALDGATFEGNLIFPEGWRPASVVPVVIAAPVDPSNPFAVIFDPENSL